MQSLSRTHILEAVLFAAGDPITISKLAEIMESPEWEVQEAEYFCADLQAAISW